MLEETKTFNPSFLRMLILMSLTFLLLVFLLGVFFPKLFELTFLSPRALIVSSLAVGFSYASTIINLGKIEITNSRIFGPKALNESLLERVSIDLRNIDTQKTFSSGVWKTIFQYGVVVSHAGEKVSLFPFAFNSNRREQIYSLLKNRL